MKPAFILPAAWQPLLDPWAKSEKAGRLAAFLEHGDAAGRHIYPPRDLRFNALQSVKPDDVKVVILGQDPYHGAGQAHGLSFSVPENVRMPPSLKNMFKELQRDFGLAVPPGGNLQRWAAQGVLLLNAVLTVEEGKPGSHQNMGWEELTDAVMAYCGSKAAEPSVFMLWGSHARKKRSLIDADRHLVLEAPHPSPLSAHRGFIGCGHFGAANRWLAQNGRNAISW